MRPPAAKGRRAHEVDEELKGHVRVGPAQSHSLGLGVSYGHVLRVLCVPTVEDVVGYAAEFCVASDTVRRISSARTKAAHPFHANLQHRVLELAAAHLCAQEGKEEDIFLETPYIGPQLIATRSRRNTPCQSPTLRNSSTGNSNDHHSVSAPQNGEQTPTRTTDPITTHVARPKSRATLLYLGFPTDRRDRGASLRS